MAIEKLDTAANGIRFVQTVEPAGKRLKIQLQQPILSFAALGQPLLEAQKIFYADRSGFQ